MNTRVNMMKGAIIKNRYYSDEGMEYVFRRLVQELAGLGADAFVTDGLTLSDSPLPDFGIYWDKDAPAAKMLEQRGLTLFNSARAVALCDDKLLTYACLTGKADYPRTLASPMMYPASDAFDREFLIKAAKLGFPLVAKARVGSQGKQVRLIVNKNELEEYYRLNRRTPHLYQCFVAESAGRDIRIYTVGGKAVAAVTRNSPSDFRSNFAAGAETLPAEPKAEFLSAAEQVSGLLGLDYGAVDFFCTNSPLIVEVNSNAYFQEAERVSGINIAGLLAAHITEAVSCRNN